jgi:hypothetical protein
MATFAGYVRVSRVSDRAETLISPQLQEREIRSWSKTRGFDVASRAGPIHGVWVWSAVEKLQPCGATRRGGGLRIHDPIHGFAHTIRGGRGGASAYRETLYSQ